MRTRLRELFSGICCCLIAISVAFSPLVNAFATSSVGTGPDGVGHMQMEDRAHHGDSVDAMVVAGTSLDDGGAPIHCDQFGACTLLCSVCLSALPQPSDALLDVPHNYNWLQHYANVNLLVDANPPLRPPRR